MEANLGPFPKVKCVTYNDTTADLEADVRFLNFKVI